MVQFPKVCSLRKAEDSMRLQADTDSFSLNLKLIYGKGAFWYGDDGVLVMGEPQDPMQRTLYYSYPNMPTFGTVNLLSATTTKTMDVVGKSWFDRQWGPYRLIESATHWEWFSLRFFDDEEIMLFAFPQQSYFDGTYIDKNGKRQFVRNYKYTPKEFVEVDGFKFSKGWDLVLPGIKETYYEIRPLMDGQMNLAYFELLAEIFNQEHERVDYCFVELLPGVQNPEKSIGIRRLFKRI